MIRQYSFFGLEEAASCETSPDTTIEKISLTDSCRSENKVHFDNSEGRIMLQAHFVGRSGNEWDIIRLKNIERYEDKYVAIPTVKKA